MQRRAFHKGSFFPACITPGQCEVLAPDGNREEAWMCGSSSALEGFRVQSSRGGMGRWLQAGVWRCAFPPKGLWGSGPWGRRLPPWPCPPSPRPWGRLPQGRASRASGQVLSSDPRPPRGLAGSLAGMFWQLAGLVPLGCVQALRSRVCVDCPEGCREVLGTVHSSVPASQQARPRLIGSSRMEPAESSGKSHGWSCASGEGTERVPSPPLRPMVRDRGRLQDEHSLQGRVHPGHDGSRGLSRP